MHVRIGKITYQRAVWAGHSSGEDEVAALASLQEFLLRLKIGLNLRDCWEDSRWRRGWGQNARRRRWGERAWWRRRRRGPCSSHGLCPAHPHHHKTVGRAPPFRFEPAILVQRLHGPRSNGSSMAMQARRMFCWPHARQAQEQATLQLRDTSMRPRQALSTPTCDRNGKLREGLARSDWCWWRGWRGRRAHILHIMHTNYE